MKDDRLYLQHIAEAVGRIASYTSGGRQAFLAESMIQDAVIRNFEIIGEATKRLSEIVKANEPQVPWRDVAGLRDVLIHGYMGVDLQEVWNVVENHLPSLRDAVNRLLDK